MDMNSLLQVYSKIQVEIEARLLDFKKIWQNSSESEIFVELCFCLCTPQTKAVNADKAIKRLVQDGVLFAGNAEDIAKYLQGLVRFHNNKANYIVQARNLFASGKKYFIRQKIDAENIDKTRQYFFENIKGLGLKEASHFLRNIGFGENLAILDRHILKNLCSLKVIDEIPKNLDKKNYLAIEQKLRLFSEKTKIPMDHLDFIMWYNEAGKIFK